MNYIFESAGSGHEYGVDVGLPEETRRAGNNQRDVDFVDLSGLANVACPDEPCDVLFSVGPPKTI